MAIPKKPVNIDVDKLVEKAGEAQVNVNRVKRYNLELPYDLWLELKLEAVQRGLTLKEYLLKILKNRKQIKGL